ncbi:hypothetical protein MHYP_G00020340 [Metynnis hypsauchen]
MKQLNRLHPPRLTTLKMDPHPLRRWTRPTTTLKLGNSPRRRTRGPPQIPPAGTPKTYTPPQAVNVLTSAPPTAITPLTSTPLQEALLTFTVAC